jgi:hypothetical protein
VAVLVTIAFGGLAYLLFSGGPEARPWMINGKKPGPDATELDSPA